MFYVKRAGIELVARTCPDVDSGLLPQSRKVLLDPGSLHHIVDCLRGDIISRTVAGVSRLFQDQLKQPNGDRRDGRLAQGKSRLTRVHLTDNDAQLMKGRQGIMPGYNAQAMVSPVAGLTGNGLLITAADVVTTAADSDQLIPMLEKSEEMTGERHRQLHLP